LAWLIETALQAECGSAEGMELQLTRSARSMQAALTLALGADEGANSRDPRRDGRLF